MPGFGGGGAAPAQVGRRERTGGADDDRDFRRRRPRRLEPRPRTGGPSARAARSCPRRAGGWSDETPSGRRLRWAAIQAPLYQNTAGHAATELWVAPAMDGVGHRQRSSGARVAPDHPSAARHSAAGPANWDARSRPMDAIRAEPATSVSEWPAPGSSRLPEDHGARRQRRDYGASRQVVLQRPSATLRRPINGSRTGCRPGCTRRGRPRSSRLPTLPGTVAERQGVEPDVGPFADRCRGVRGARRGRQAQVVRAPVDEGVGRVERHRHPHGPAVVAAGGARRDGARRRRSPPR